MKITKKQIKELIKEELETIAESYGYDYDEFNVGDVVEIEIEEGGTKNIERVKEVPEDFDEPSPYPVEAKFLAKIIKVAGEPAEDEFPPI